MAIVKLEKATVMYLHARGHGVTVKEPDRTSGGDRTFKGERFALWFKEPTGLTVGDVISVSGFLAAKVGDPWKGNDGADHVSVELSINSPKLDGFPAKGSGNEPVQSAAEQPNWPNAEVPF